MENKTTLRIASIAIVATTALAFHHSSYSVWWNPFTWFEKEVPAEHSTSDLYKTPTLCPRTASLGQTTGKPVIKPDTTPAAPASSATDPFAAKTSNPDSCPAGQQLCVGNLGDDNNSTFCSSGNCPMESAPVLNKPIKK